MIENIIPLQIVNSSDINLKFKLKAKHLKLHLNIKYIIDFLMNGFFILKRIVFHRREKQ